jgi:hypothetical protein
MSDQHLPLLRPIAIKRLPLLDLQQAGRAGKALGKSINGRESLNSWQALPSFEHGSKAIR